MSKIPYNFSTPIPSYFRQNGWFPKNQIGHKNRTFLQWSFDNCMCCDHEITHNGKTILLSSYEFLYTCTLCEEDTGLTTKESNGRIERSLSEGILKKVEEKSTRKYSIYRWVEESFEVLQKKKAHQNHRENEEKRRTKNIKGAPKSVPKGVPNNSYESAPKTTVENEEKSAPTENQESAPKSAPKSAPFLNNINNYKNLCVNETLSFAREDIENASRRWKLNAEQKNCLSWLCSKNIDSPIETLCWWSKEYDYSRLVDVYNSAIAYKPDSIGKYMHHLLKSKASVENDQSRDNKQLAMDYKFANKWDRLIFSNRYVTCKNDQGSEREIPFDISSDVFFERLMDMHNWCINNY